MELLPTQTLPAVSHIVFGIFNLTIPNVIAWSIVAVVFLIAAWARMPKVFEPKSQTGIEVEHELD